MMSKRRKRTQKALTPEQQAARLRKTAPVMTLEERLYRVYGTSANWMNFQGDPMPTWGLLLPRVKRHWQAVAADCHAYAQEALTAMIKDSVEHVRAAAVKEGIILETPRELCECPACGGRGSTPSGVTLNGDDDGRTCEVCDGTGKVTQAEHDQWIHSGHPRRRPPQQEHRG